MPSLSAQRIIRLRQANPCMTLAAIGNTVGVTREWVRQALNKAGLETAAYNTRPRVACMQCGSPTRRVKTGLCSLSCTRAHNSLSLVCMECHMFFLRRKSVVMKATKRQYYTGLQFCSRRCLGLWFGKKYGFGSPNETSKQRQAQRQKTHCKRGHPLTLDNTYVYSTRRMCRACTRLRGEVIRRRTS